MTVARCALLLTFAAVLAGCGHASKAPLAGDPQGTVDTTHGAVGAQTSPR